MLAYAGHICAVFLQPVFGTLEILYGWIQFINRLLIIYSQVFAGPLEFTLRKHSRQQE